VKIVIIVSMSACASQTFSGVTPAQFEALTRKASSIAGVTIESRTGSCSRSGFTIIWDYDAAELRLVIQCTASPFNVTCGSINQRIHDLVDSAAAQ
jgi:hypothetical protein